jgi:quinol monooxygenase YgiN
MAEKRVTVLAVIRARAGMEERVKQELLAMVGPTRKEAGCINYDLHQSTGDTGLFMFYENWRSQKDLDDHLAAPHFKAFASKGGEILDVPAEVTFWEKIG